MSQGSNAIAAPIGRRAFTKGTAAAGAVLATGGSAVAWVLRGGRPVAFELTFAPDLMVWMGNGERFPIELRRDGVVIERHELTSAQLVELESEHLSVREIDAPGVAARR